MKAQVLEFLFQEKQTVEAISSNIELRIEYDAKETTRALDPTPRNIIDYKFIDNNLDELLADGWQVCDDATDMVQKTVIETSGEIAKRQAILPHWLTRTVALHRWHRIATGKLTRIKKCIEWVHQTKK